MKPRIYAHMLTVKQIDAANLQKNHIALLILEACSVHCLHQAKGVAEMRYRFEGKERRWSSVPIHQISLTEAGQNSLTRK